MGGGKVVYHGLKLVNIYVSGECRILQSLIQDSLIHRGMHGHSRMDISVSVLTRWSKGLYWLVVCSLWGTPCKEILDPHSGSFSLTFIKDKLISNTWTWFTVLMGFSSVACTSFSVKA